jgi:tryptophanyl-tRNA synthetase
VFDGPSLAGQFRVIGWSRLEACSPGGPVPTSAPGDPDASSLQAARRRSAALNAAIRQNPGQFRVLTGDRPTGPLHVGHLFGTLLNRVRLQDLGVEVMVLIADYQTLTDRDAPGSLPADVLGLVADYLAVGIDPQRAAIFAHSQIEPLNQLLIPFLSLVSVAEVSRNPTVKEEFGAAGGSSMSALMFTYPVHQAADILFCHANLVPVGKDQLPHLELTRTIARRFNDRYSPAKPYFTAPDALLSDAPLLLGTDGQKMSKSRGNAIALAASEDETARLIRAARTDDQRTITYDPDSRPAVSNLVQLTALCLETTPEQVAAELGGGGAAALKRLLTEALNERLRPIRARRREVAADPGYLRQILAGGNERARAQAGRTLCDVQGLMHTRY